MEEVYEKNNFDEVILYYNNEDERKAFERYIENNQVLVENYLTETKRVYFTVDIGNEKEVQYYKHKLAVGLALNKLLKEFRLLNR